MFKRERYVLLVITAVAVCLAGCGEKDGEKDAAVVNEITTQDAGTYAVTAATADSRDQTSRQTTAEETKETYAVETKDNSLEDPGFIYPQKGVRPVAVMIDNEGTRPLPQGGLDRAQIVYEMLVEGGATRFMAVFWGTDPPMVGPVRSARHYFLDYAMENDAVFVHFGWSPMAKRDISTFNIDNANGVANGGWIFWDITDNPGNWQDSYTSMEKIESYVKSAGYSNESTKQRVFEYSQKFIVPETGSNAEKVELCYSYYRCGYEYNTETGLYSRTRMGSPHIERNSKEQLKCANILIQIIRNHTMKGDRYGRQNLENTGTGSGYYITCGKAIEIEWSKQTRTGKTSYFDKDGNAVVLNPGRTWIQIMPVSGSIEFK